MTQILRRDCLLHWARWSYVSPFGTTRRYIPQETFFPKAHITCSLLTKLVWFRWLDDGLVFLFCGFMDLDSLSVHEQAKQKPICLVHVIHTVSIS